MTRFFRTAHAVVLCTLMASAADAQAPRRGGPPPTAKPAPAPQFFTTPLTLDQMKGKQAVIDTDMGTIIVDLLPESAPNHVGYFIKNAQEGAYAGTVFHRVVRQGIVQGGDPLTKDPSKADAYGTGGFGVLRAERNAEKNTRGAVSAVVGAGSREKPPAGGRCKPSLGAFENASLHFQTPTREFSARPVALRLRRRAALRVRRGAWG